MSGNGRPRVRGRDLVKEAALAGAGGVAARERAVGPGLLPGRGAWRVRVSLVAPGVGVAGPGGRFGGAARWRGERGHGGGRSLKLSCAGRSLQLGNTWPLKPTCA